MSRTRHDRLDKEALNLWLGELGLVELDAPIAGEVLHADVLFQSRGRRLAARHALGLLGMLAQGTTLFEIFRNPVTDRELSVARAKLVLVHEDRHREARRQQRAASTIALAALCVLSPHVSQPQRVRFGMTRSPGLPRGVLQLPEADRTLVVAIDELPADASTLWLRLLGRDSVQSAAIEELVARVEPEMLVDATLDLLVAWQRSLPAQAQDEEQNEMNTHLQKVYDRWEQKVLARGRAEGEAEGEAKGKAEGEAKGKAEAVLAVLAARGVRASAAQRRRILATKDLTALDGWLAKAVSVASTAELLR